jgi:hypothetical protein
MIFIYGFITPGLPCPVSILKSQPFANPLSRSQLESVIRTPAQPPASGFGHAGLTMKKLVQVGVG